MLELYATPPSGEQLFEMDFRPNEEFLHKGNFDQLTIEALRGRRNRILVGVPQVFNVLTNWPMNESLAEEMKALQNKWDFYSVRLACSFVPDPRGCRFVWGRIQVELLVDDAETSPESEAIAFDQFPREVELKQVFRRHYRIAPTLRYAFAEASVEVGSEQEIVRYEPTIVADGLLTAMPAWSFRSKQGLVGNRELFLLVKKPKDTTVQAHFTLGAEVHSVFGPLPVKGYRNDELMGKTYILIPS